MKDHTAVRGGAELHPIPSPGDDWGRDTESTAGEGHIPAFVHHIQVLKGRDINLSTDWMQGKQKAMKQTATGLSMKMLVQTVFEAAAAKIYLLPHQELVYKFSTYIHESFQRCAYAII